MKKKILSSTLWLFLFFGLCCLISKPGFAKASMTDNQFTQANQAYEQGNYEDALKTYLGLVGQGYEGASLFYNIGNTYYRRGERGPAVLWYERALRLSPRDADIQFNLSLAKSHLKEQKDSWLERLVMFLTPKELGGLFSVIWWGFFILLGLAILGWVKGEIWPTLTLWSLGIMGILIGIWLSANIVISDQQAGIVTKAPGEVRNGPGMEYAVGFTVPEGTQILMLNQRPDWVEVGIPQEGLKGWMPTDEVERVSWNFSSSS